MNGTWENSTWSTSQTVAGTSAWVENTAALFAMRTGTGTPAFTITMNANHTVAGLFSGPLTPNPCTMTVAGTGTIMLPANLQGFDVNSNTSDPGIITINVPMTDAGSGASSCEFTAEGSGQLYLGAANTFHGGVLWGYSGASFSGIININTGTWSLPNNSPFGSGGICFSNTSTSIAALVVNGTGATVIPNNITNAATGGLVSGTKPQIHIVAPSGGLTFSGEWDVLGQAKIGVSSYPVTQTGVMKGAGGFSTIVVSSPSTFALNGANTFTGSTTNVSGTLSASTIADTASSGIGLGANLTLGGGTFQYTGAGAATTTRACWLTAASTLDLPAGNLELDGAFKSVGASTVLTKSSAGTLTLGGTGDNSSLALNVTGGTVVLAKGPSAAGVHGIGGATTVGSGGTLQMAGSGGFQIYSGVALTVSSGGVFDANGQSDTFTSLTMSGNGGGSGALINNSGTTSTLTCTAANGFPLAAATTVGGSGNITLAGVVSGTGFGLTYSGSGTLTLNSANTYSGGTTISSGTLTIGSSGTLGGGSYAGAIANSGTFTYNSSASQTLTGGSSGTGALKVTGAGTLTLSGTAAYNSGGGATTVSAGSLLVASGSVLGAGSSTVTVNGGSLGGTGGINDPTTVNAGGTLSTVDSAIGTLSFANGLTLAGTTKLEISASALTADLLSVNGGVHLGGNLTLVNIAGTPALGNTFTLFSGTIASGTFASVTTSPTLPTGLKWDTSQLVAGGAGTITVACDGTLAAHAGANQDICSGASATLGGSPTATGGSLSGYTYLWSPGGATTANPSVSPASTTTYTVTVTDANGCTANSSMTVYVNAAPAIGTQPGSTAVCSGSTATFSVGATGSGLGYSWANDNNAGWGSVWTVTGSGGTWLGTSTDNDNFQPSCNSFSANLGDIDSPISGAALGMWGGSGGDEVATRSFAPLTVGQVVSIDFDNGNVDTGSKVGFSLQTSVPADVLQFYFLGGGPANYQYWDDSGAGQQDTGIGWGYTGNRVQFVLTSATTYSLIITPCGGTPTTITGNFSGASIAQVKLFNGNTAGGDPDNVYFNNFLIGGYTDNADNYSGGWAGLDKGNQPIAVGNGGSTYTTPALTVANSGSKYQVVVSGCAGTKLSTAATVTVNPLPTVTVNSPTVCASALPAVVTATPAGGTAPYNYAWTVPVGETAPGNVANVNATVAGSYSVIVTDANGCASVSGSGVVTINANPTVTVNSPTVCSTDPPATITATPAGGTPPYSYAWTVPSGPNPGNVVSFTTSIAGNYTVVVTDSSSTLCTGSGSGTLTVNPAATASTGGNQTICSSSSSTAPLAGVVGGGATGGTWSSPSGGTFLPHATSLNATYNPTPADILAGSVTLTLTTTGQLSPCGAATAQVIVTINPAATASAGGNQTICSSSSSTAPLAGVVGGGATGGIWSSLGTGSFTPSATTLNATYSPSPAEVSAGTATLTLTTTGQLSPCGPATAQVIVTINPAATASAGGNQSICAGNSTAGLGGSVGGGATGGTWMSTGTGNFTPHVTSLNAVYNPSPADILAGSVTLTLTTTGQASPCGAATAQVVVTINALPTVSVNSVAICPGGSATLNTTTSATSPSYLWSPGGATTSSITVSPGATQVYTVTVTDGVTGCVNSGSGTVTVNPGPTAVAGTAQTICAGSPVTIGGAASGGTAPYTYSWLPTTGLSDPTAASPTAAVGTTTTYTVTVTDHNGCTGNASVVLTVIPEPVLDTTTLVGGDVVLVWESLSGQTYRVQYTSVLVDAATVWTDLTGPASVPLMSDVTATGATATYTDAGAPTPRFYRIKIVCP